MTTPGRPRHSAKAHKLRGTRPRYDEDELEDLELTAGGPAPPGWLPDSALCHWHEVTPQLNAMGMATEADAALLAMLCVYYGQFVTAAIAVAKEGATVLTTAGNPVNNPNLTARDVACANYLKIANQFGLSPASRLKLGMKYVR